MKKISLNINWHNINIPLLLFLIFFLNVKFVIKLLALVLIIIYSKNIKLGISWKNSRIPLFYFLIICLELLKYFLVTRNYTVSYILVFSMGILQWCVSLLAIHYIKLFVENDPVERVHYTIKSFFLLNYLVSFFFLCLLLFQPVWLKYWGHGTDISILSPSAGDTILGITFDTSTVNATINSIGLVYFLYKREYLFCFLSILTIALCTSNVTFLLIATLLGCMFLTVRHKRLRLAVFLSGVLLTTFYLLVSPSNRGYIRNYFVQLYIVNKNPELVANAPSGDNDTLLNRSSVQKKVPDSVYSFSEKKLEKALHNLFSLSESQTDASGTPQLQLSSEDFNSKPGKLISFFQTYNYLISDSKNFLFGAGIGNFSSKLAFRTAGIKQQGNYPEKYQHIAPEFKANHLKTFLFYFNSDASRHSVLNYPFSVYNQIPGEYGIIGVTFFLLFYLGYFIKRYRSLNYGRYLIPLLLGFFLMEYWFEMYSLITVFELLILLNLKENSFDKSA
jgi:hypothetical protein